MKTNTCLTMTLILFALSVMAEKMPPFKVKDQFNQPLSARQLEKGHGAIIVYRARVKTAVSRSHYLALSKSRRGLFVVRIGDISRVPGLFHFAVIQTLKKKDPHSSYYLDKTGEAVKGFPVKNGQAGFFLYYNGKEILRKIGNAKNEKELAAGFKAFLAGVKAVLGAAR